MKYKQCKNLLDPSAFSWSKNTEICNGCFAFNEKKEFEDDEFNEEEISEDDFDGEGLDNLEKESNISI